jgi:hypothetical protein
MMDEYQKIIPCSLPYSVVQAMEQFTKWNRWSIPLTHTWLTWAKSLIDQYNQTALPYRTLSMIFVHPSMVNKLVDERLTFTLQRLYPRINLVFHQNVSNTDKRYHVLNHQPHNEFLTKSVLNRFNTFLYYHEKRNRSQEYPVLIQRHQNMHAQKTDMTYNAGQYDYTSEGNKNPLSPLVIQDSPLKRVFKRLHQGQDVVFINQHRRVVVEDAEGITKRFVQKTQRVEEYITKVPTLISRQPQVSVPQRSSPGIKQQVMEPDSSVHKKAPFEMQNTQAIPAMTIDNLTDQVIRQIDKRIIARRERMGKI